MKSKVIYRLQQFLIFLLHIFLLSWILYTLSNSGGLKFNEVLFHFVGITIYGGSLIAGTALWSKKRYLKENSF